NPCPVERQGRGRGHVAPIGRSPRPLLRERRPSWRIQRMPFSDHPFDLGCSPTWTPRTSRTRGDQNVMENRLCLPALILCGGLLVACRAGPAPVPELGPRPPVALVDAAADAEGGAPPPVTQLPAVDVWTQHNDNARTGANLREVA